MNPAAIGYRLLSLLGLQSTLARRLAPLGFAFALLMACGAAWGLFRAWDWWDDRQAVERAVNKANVEALEAKARADEQAQIQAELDRRAIEGNLFEAIEAIEGTEDEKPSAAAIAHGCVRLRRAGLARADLPEPCRSGEAAGR